MTVVPGRSSIVSIASTGSNAAPLPIDTHRSTPAPSSARPPMMVEVSEPLWDTTDTPPTRRSAGTGAPSGAMPARKSANPTPLGP